MKNLKRAGHRRMLVNPIITRERERERQRWESKTEIGSEMWQQKRLSGVRIKGSVLKAFRDVTFNKQVLTVAWLNATQRNFMEIYFQGRCGLDREHSLEKVKKVAACSRIDWSISVFTSCVWGISGKVGSRQRGGIRAEKIHKLLPFLL